MSRERGFRGRASRWRMAAGDADEVDQPDPPDPDETEDSDTEIGADTVGGSGSPPEAEERIGPADCVTVLPLTPPPLPSRRWRASPGVALWLAAAACGGSALVLALLLAALLRDSASSPPPGRQLPEAPAVRPLDAAEQQQRGEGLNSLAAMGRAEEARLHQAEAEGPAANDPPFDVRER